MPDDATADLQARFDAAETTLLAAEAALQNVEAPAELLCDLHNEMGILAKDAGRYAQAGCKK